MTAPAEEPEAEHAVEDQPNDSEGVVVEAEAAAEADGEVAADPEAHVDELVHEPLEDAEGDSSKSDVHDYERQDEHPAQDPAEQDFYDSKQHQPPLEKRDSFGFNATLDLEI